MNLFRNPTEAQVKHLLAESKLPSSDLSPRHLEHFFGCGPVEAPNGVVGLEIYGDVALLRSLAVAPDSRGNGHGKALVAQAERYAHAQGVTKVYLLTTTAAAFFERLGYRRTDRESAPEPIRQTEEFSALCPSSSTFMVKYHRKPMPSEFSEIAKRYRETSLVQQSAAETLFRLLAIRGSEDVLDVGCGTGNLTKKIRVATSGRVVGIDPAEGMIERAAREHGDGIDFAVSSAEAMSFHEEFDIIFCNSAFQWVRDADKAVAGFAGALRAGGRVGIQAPARSDYCPNFLAAIRDVAADPSLGPTFAHFKSPWCFFQDASEYSALFVRHGFQVPFAEIQTVDSTHTPSQTFDIFASGAIAGYLDPSCYGCPLDEQYMTGFRQTIREQFERQAGPDGLVRLVFRRIFLVAVRA